MNINKEYKRKEEDSMSFIGMKICNNGIVAFGDSKSSKYINGCLTCDKERGEFRRYLNMIILLYLHGELMKL